MRRLCAAILALLCLLPLCGCGGGNKAAAMHLRKTEGDVWVSDENQRDVPLAEELSLYGGYRLDTWSESFAWIDLDNVKLAKMDADSEVTIEKNGKDLEISLTAGRVFFRVTEPLEEDETMTIRTADLLVGIRGTCGWVEAGDGQSRVGLLEGKVRCESEEGGKASVSAGEKAETAAEGVIVSPLTLQDIPLFVLDEIEEDQDLYEQVLDDLGIDVLAMRRLEGVFEGVYYPSQGESALTLTVFQEEGQYRAMFDFGSLPGRSNCKEGSYFMEVSYDTESGLYTFIGTEWIEQPSGYVFVDLGGTLEGDVLSGDVYTRMELRRVSQTGTPPLPLTEPAEEDDAGVPDAEDTVPGFAVQEEPAVSEPEPVEPEPVEPEPANLPLGGYAGTYTPYSGFYTSDLMGNASISADGVITGGGKSYNTFRGAGMTPQSITTEADGRVVIKYVDTPDNQEIVTIYPVGVAPAYVSYVDTSKVNMEYFTYDGGVMSYFFYADPASLS